MLFYKLKFYAYYELSHVAAKGYGDKFCSFGDEWGVIRYQWVNYKISADIMWITIKILHVLR